MEHHALTSNNAPALTPIPNIGDLCQLFVRAGEIAYETKSDYFLENFYFPIYDKPGCYTYLGYVGGNGARSPYFQLFVNPDNKMSLEDYGVYDDVVPLDSLGRTPELCAALNFNLDMSPVGVDFALHFAIDQLAPRFTPDLDRILKSNEKTSRRLRSFHLAESRPKHTNDPDAIGLV